MIHTDLVKLMEQAKEEKKDFHKLVATKMFNVIYEDVTAEQRIRSIADKLALKILAEYSIMDQGTHILIQVKKQ